MMLKNVGLRDFTDEVLLAGKPVLVDFYHDACPPCRALKPILADMAKDGYPIVGVNVMDEPELAAHYGIKSVPTLMLMNGDNVVYRTAGLKNRRQLVQVFDGMAA